MDKIEKALQRLAVYEREIVRALLGALLAGNTVGYDIKKLKGREDIFRIKKGRVRIIYRRTPDGKMYILSIERRNERTYKFDD